jgi:uncharacterized protein
MLNPTYFYDKVQELFAEFKPDFNLEQARLRMMESAMWLGHATPTEEALSRDLAAAPSARLLTPEERPDFDWPTRARNQYKPSSLEYVNEDTLIKVFEALVGADGGYQLSGDHAREAITAMQNAGILFRERQK